MKDHEFQFIVLCIKFVKFVYMEKLVINVPDGKSNIVKQVLHSLGVTIPGYDAPIKGEYKKSLLKITVWSAEDLKQIEDASKALNNLKAEEW